MEPLSNQPAPATPWGLIRTVASGMAGIRGRSNHERDASALKPVHIVIAAVFFMFIFVSVMVTIASLVVGK